MKKLLLLPILVFLAAPLGFAQNAVQEARTHLERNAFRYDLSPADVSDIIVTNAYTSRRSGTTHVYLRQQVNGLDITSGNFTINVNRAGHVFHAAGRGVKNLNARSLSTAPAITAQEAARALALDRSLTVTEPFSAAEYHGTVEEHTILSDGGVAAAPVEARLVYHTTENNNLLLAWEVSLYELGGQHSWLAEVDAQTGRVLQLVDYVVNDSFGERSEMTGLYGRDTAPGAYLQNSTVNFAPLAERGSVGGPEYRVYAQPVVSPIYTTPLPPADARTLEVDPADAAASPFGWHDTDGIAGAEFTTTQGNNVHAYTDIDANNSPDPGSSPDGGAGLSFDFPLDLTQPPSAYRPAAVTNLFYWNNLIHDVMHHYGFDEVAGNFQATNYGGIGVDGDYVRAEAQDGSGTNNANFCTPPEGGSTGCGSVPRMQMYIGTNPNPDQDGDLDNHVIVHEYGHGISRRLIGGPATVSCMNNSEQGGEGWSDWIGLMLTMDPSDTRTTSRPVGNYLFGQPAGGGGIRPAPYNTNFAVNDYTYGDTQTQVVPHGVGFVWATILWEATWDMIDVHGFDADIWNASGTAGNQMMLQLVIEGLKLTACSPGFVDARDAILSADLALYGGAHIDLLWSAFARRGLGLGADQGSSSTNSDNIEAFNEPEEVAPDPVTDLAAAAAALGIELTWTATGDDGSTGTADSYDIRYSTSPITNDTEFDAATQAIGEPAPQPAGSSESFTVTGLDFDETYHFAMKVHDESFNVSDISNPASATTNSAPVLSIDTSPIWVGVMPGETFTYPLSVGNTGGSDLVYSIDFTETTAGAREPYSGGGTTPPIDPAPPEDKNAPEIPGVENLRGMGGPDAFGYSWIDSNEPAGPAYVWNDISGTGTALNFGDDDSELVALPFTFDFYGASQNNVRIGSNGYVTFGSDGTDYSNDPIPTNTDPNDLIAPFWDDLDPGDGGQVYYQDMGDGRFIVQWDEVPHYPSSGTGTYTFQVVLNSSGTIYFYYEDMIGDLDSATIGIENNDASIGLQVINNAAYVENGLAVRIADIWVSANPASGNVSPGGSESVDLFFDSAGLAEGTYTADMTITTNEPATAAASVTIPITFVVDEDIPVELTSLGARIEGTDVLLSWATASETNNAGFEVQHQMEDGSFEVLDFVDGNGTTTEAQTYNYRVSGMDIGTHVFRLRQIDFDGAFEITGEIEVTLNVVGTHLLSSVYPNPFNPRAQFTLAVAQQQSVQISLYDALGRRVAMLHDGALEANQTYNFAIDGSSLSSGAYFVRVAGEHFNTSQQITLLK